MAGHEAMTGELMEKVKKTEIPDACMICKRESVRAHLSASRAVFAGKKRTMIL